MKWNKKMKTAAAIVLAVGFAAGGLTVYANTVNRQSVFTASENLRPQSSVEIENKLEDEKETAPVEPGVVAQVKENQGGTGASAPAQAEGNAGDDAAEPVAITDAALVENGAAVVSSDALQKAYISRRNVRIVDPDKPMIALTYDDGPYTAVTDRILDALEEHGGRATFFVVGNRVANFPETMNRIADEGHELGNHSYTHTKFTKLNEEELFKEINDTQYIISHTSEVLPELLRLPYGARNDLVMENAGMPMIQWSLDTLDWKTRDAESTINRVLDTVKDGDIVLMHDLYPATAEASEVLIPLLIERGYQLVTVSELLSARGIELDEKTLYYNAPLEEKADPDELEKEVERYEGAEEQK